MLQELKWPSGGRAIRPAASLNYSAPLRIDLDGQDVVDFFTPPEPEGPDAGHPPAAAVGVAGDTMMQGCAFRPELCTVREFHHLPPARRISGIPTRLLDQHRP